MSDRTSFKAKRIIIAVILLLLILVFINRFNLSVDPKSQKSKSSTTIRKMTAGELKQSLNQKSEQIPAPLETTIANDEPTREDLCWEKIQGQMDSVQFAEKYQDQLSTVIGSWFYNGKKPNRDYNPTAPADKFMFALSIAGLIVDLKDEPTSDHESLERAAQLLLEVHQEDPLNAAPIAYLAIINQKLSNLFESKIWLQKLDQAKHFDTYEKSISTKIFSLIESPSDLIDATLLNSKTPIVDYMALRKILIENKKSRVAEMLIFNNRKTPNSFESVDYLPVEYAIGASILKNMQIRHQYPDYKSEFLNNPNSLDTLGKKIFDDLMKDCEITVLFPYVDQLKAKINSKQ